MLAPPQQGYAPRPQSQPQTQAQPAQIEHSDVIHDTQFDYYGKLLATASSDRTIGIHHIHDGGAIQRVATLAGHDGPVWMVSWAHPRFGNIISSSSYDQRAIIWKEKAQASQKWAPVHVISIHQGSVNAVQWAPMEFGPMVATASSDGTVAVTSYAEGGWQESLKLSNNSNQIAHAMGATCVSFAPFSSALPGALMLASGGCDSSIRLWMAAPQNGQGHPFRLHQVLDGHTDWVRDVAFCSMSPASRYVMLASCGQDKTVILYRKPWAQIAAEVDSARGGGAGADTSTALSAWERSVVTFDEPIWRLSWSTYGETLVVTTAESEVVVLREGTHFTEPWIKVPLSDYQQPQ